jgi:hypothetical protein
MKLFCTMQCKSCARKAIVLFFQHCYWGWRGRVRAESRRELLRQMRRDKSASAIQANVQRVIQRRGYLNLLLEKEQLSNQSATAIQAMMRGRITRQMYQAEMKRQCNTIIFVVGIGQDITGCITEEWEKKMEEEGCKIKVVGGAGWRWGTLCSASLGVAVGKGIFLLQDLMERRWRSGNNDQGRRKNG